MSRSARTANNAAPVTAIWLVRHGQRQDTDPTWRPQRCHHTEVPLSALGQRQAQALGQRLIGSPIRTLYCSPYLRAVQTAAAIAKETGLRIHIEAGVMEWQNPQWFPKRPPLETVAALAARFTAIDPTYRSQVRPVWPETQVEALARLDRTMHRLIARSTGEILLVGHGVTVLGMSKALLDPPYAAVDEALCGVVKLVPHKKSWRLQLNGDTSHLAKLGGALH